MPPFVVNGLVHGQSRLQGTFSGLAFCRADHHWTDGLSPLCVLYPVHYNRVIVQCFQTRHTDTQLLSRERRVSLLSKRSPTILISSRFRTAYVAPVAAYFWWHSRGGRSYRSSLRSWLYLWHDILGSSTRLLDTTTSYPPLSKPRTTLVQCPLSLRASQHFSTRPLVTSKVLATMQVCTSTIFSTVIANTQDVFCGRRDLSSSSPLLFYA